MAKTAKTAVFWDTEDCQIPDGLNAVVVSQNIRSALEKMNYGGTVSIYAYGDTNQIKAGLEKTRFVFKTREPAEEAHKEYLGTASICDTDALESPEIMINHTPSGDKYSRLEKIIIDSFSWALDNPGPANVMLILGDISSHMEFTSVFYRLDAAHYRVLLAQPGIESSPYPVRTKWLWESLSVGGDPVGDDQTQSDIDQLDSEDESLSVGGDPVGGDQTESTNLDHLDSEDDQIESVDNTSVGRRIPKRFFAAGILVCTLIDHTAAGSRIPRYLLAAGSFVCTMVAFFLDR